MGVQGLTSLLQKEGWLPEPDMFLCGCCERVSLWRGNDDDVLTNNQRIETIPPGSTLALDGNGLAYYLHRVAYFRHYAKVVSAADNDDDGNGSAANRGGKHKKQQKKKKRKQQNGYFGCGLCNDNNNKNNKLTEEQVTKLLPSNLPLATLDNVTREFVHTLLRKEHEFKLLVFWDGQDRRMKAGTTRKRFDDRTLEWTNLQQYTLYGGTLPFSKHSPQNFLSKFPLSALLVEQVRSTLYSMQIKKNHQQQQQQQQQQEKQQQSNANKEVNSVITMINCSEEADVEVARASALDPSCYCIGLDSDYCLFPGTKYIPLNTLHVAHANDTGGWGGSGDAVTGCLITRAELVILFDLPCEESMVELAILMGNDYIGSPRDAQLHGFYGKTVEEAMEYLREQGPEYRVVSKLPEIQTALDFTRALYGFQSLEMFPLDDDVVVVDDVNESESNEPVSDRPMLPKGLDLDLASPTSQDKSLGDVVARAILAFLDNYENETPSRMIGVQHLEIFKRVSAVANQPTRGGIPRPHYSDILAAYTIEKCISHVLRTSQSDPRVRSWSPMKTFDNLAFHSLMSATRAQCKEGEGQKNGNTVESEMGQNEKEPAQAPSVQLPIDEHEEIILETIKRQRVTIIHGETGCGKSSRVPVMLLRAPLPDPSLPRAKVFISQPRRIAAKSLVERVRSCEPDLKDAIGLRMGHGVREYESSKTRAWFVTTGYIVRLLANHPDAFDDVSHLIIDEVHERSVDTDILCLLSRRLLERNTKIRLILMSATMAAHLYASYFNLTEPPIHVGARRFPIRECFVEDLEKRFRLSPRDAKAAQSISEECDKNMCLTAPSGKHMANMFQLAAKITQFVGRPGTSVLIFVPGMNEIISIIDLIEKVSTPGITYTCFPIHSDVPFDEQMAAFDTPGTNEVKVVIATNAAESSVTLPSVDHVICLGLCKQIVYNPSSHRQMLTPAWISKASATQRAGRTGRVREGNVYRLYSRVAYNEYMEKFEVGEMVRIPLDSLILSLKEMLKEAATPILLDCLEPPDISTIERSFRSLYHSNFISDPDDGGEITNLGSFVSALGIDLSLGSLIGLGIQFGVGAEAIEMAAVLSFPQSPWIMTNPLWHQPSVYNDIMARTFISRCHFDANLYSEPLAIMNLLWDYEHALNQKHFAWYYRLSAQRLGHLMTTRKSLRKRVAEFLKVDMERLSVEVPPSKMSHAKTTILRILQVWVFSESIIESVHVSSDSSGTVSLSLGKNAIEEAHLEQVLHPNRHPFSLVSNKEVEQKGTFTPVTDKEFKTNEFLADFDGRFLSYGMEKEFDIMWYQTDFLLRLIVSENFATSGDFDALETHLPSEMDQMKVLVERRAANKGRGRQLRACGLWSVKDTAKGSSSSSSTETKRLCVLRWSSENPKIVARFTKLMRSKGRNLLDGTKVMSCILSSPGKRKKKNSEPAFSLKMRGLSGGDPYYADVCDLFSTPHINLMSSNYGKLTQKVTFEAAENAPVPYTGKARRELSSHISSSVTESSWGQPLLTDIPEGARVLSVISSGRRRDHVIHFSELKEADEEFKKTLDTGKGDKKRWKAIEEEEDTVEVSLNKGETKISQRWRRFGTPQAVYVAENCVPAAAVCMSEPTEVFACCANTLEVNGGGLRVEGMTLLPPGRLFLMLSFLTFGLKPFSSCPSDTDDSNNDFFVKECIRWIKEWGSLVAELGVKKSEGKIHDTTKRILLARSFHRSSEELGEELVCRPDKIRELCEVFDGVTGYAMTPWEKLYDGPFVTATESKSETRAVNRAPKPRKNTPSNLVSKLAYQNESNSKSTDEGISAFEASAITFFSKRMQRDCRNLFVVRTQRGKTIKVNGLPPTNVLTVLIKHYALALVDRGVGSEGQEEQLIRDSEVSLGEKHWTTHKVTAEKGKQWYCADFVNNIMPCIPVEGRGSVPQWIKEGRSRPNYTKDALSCIHPNFAKNVRTLEAQVIFPDSASERVILFESVEVAIRMAATFWLERQFRNHERHWYQIPFEEMISRATAMLPTSSPF